MVDVLALLLILAQQNKTCDCVIILKVWSGFINVSHSNAKEEACNSCKHESYKSEVVAH